MSSHGVCETPMRAITSRGRGHDEDVLSQAAAGHERVRRHMRTPGSGGGLVAAIGPEPRRVAEGLAARCQPRRMVDPARRQDAHARDFGDTSERYPSWTIRRAPGSAIGFTSIGIVSTDFDGFRKSSARLRICTTVTWPSSIAAEAGRAPNQQRSNRRFCKHAIGVWCCCHPIHRW